MRPIDEVYDRALAIQREIDSLRGACKHPRYRIGWYSWRVGAMDPKRLCEDCDAIVDGITAEEASAFAIAQGLGMPTSSSSTTILKSNLPLEK